VLTIDAENPPSPISVPLPRLSGTLRHLNFGHSWIFDPLAVAFWVAGFCRADALIVDDVYPRSDMWRDVRMIATGIQASRRFEATNTRRMQGELQSLSHHANYLQGLVFSLQEENARLQSSMSLSGNGRSVLGCLILLKAICISDFLSCDQSSFSLRSYAIVA
jgi:hypothetical protein